MMSQETMQSSTSSAAKVPHSLKLQGETQEKREEKMAKISAEAIHQDSDVDNDLAVRIFCCFYANGTVPNDQFHPSRN